MQTELAFSSEASWRFVEGGQHQCRYREWSWTFNKRVRLRPASQVSALNFAITACLQLISQKNPLLNDPLHLLTKITVENMAANTAYIAASANRFGQAADVSPSSKLIAFGSSALVALWEPGVREKHNWNLDFVLTFFEERER